METQPIKVSRWGVVVYIAITIFLTDTPCGEAKTPHKATPSVRVGLASWYSSKDACKHNRHKGCPTASGKGLYRLEKEKVYYCASYSFPLKTRLRVTGRSGRTVQCIVLDRGPAKRLHRVLDLSKSAYAKIASTKTGVVPVKIEVI